MILETKRLLLRPFDESDAESVYEYAKDPDIGPIAGWPAHTGVDNSREIIISVLSAPETYAICLKPENKAIGAVGLMIGGKSNLDLQENEGEIGYWLGKPFWGQGIMPEAVRELVRHAFIDLHLEKLWCGYFDGNKKSKRAQEKCGFKYHHTNKDIYWKQMDDIRTEHITLLTMKNWKENFSVRILTNDEIPEALKLTWNVFMKYVAPGYSKKGIKTFQDSLKDQKRIDSLCFYGAFNGDVMIGTLCMRHPDHIGGFFVSSDYLGCGVGRMLFDAMKKDFSNRDITVNSSPYAVEIYKKLGFVPTGPEQTTDGIRFTPMIFKSEPSY